MWLKDAKLELGSRGAGVEDFNWLKKAAVMLNVTILKCLITRNRSKVNGQTLANFEKKAKTAERLLA